MHRILNFDEHIIAQFQNGTDMKIWTDGILKKKEMNYDNFKMNWSPIYQFQISQVQRKAKNMS